MVHRIPEGQMWLWHDPFVYCVENTRKGWGGGQQRKKVEGDCNNLLARLCWLGCSSVRWGVVRNSGIQDVL